jgi:GNAT superfamily N-acetyltransferase
MSGMGGVTIYYLESRSRAELVPAADPGGLEIREARVRQFALNRFLYQLVGAPWQWTDKLDWSEQQWRDYAERDDLRTWVAWTDGSPAGYFELERQAGDTVDIAYFGLAPAFIGRGLGSHLLSSCLEQAWDWRDARGATRRVTVNTCSLDHPAALHNYQARGMTVYKTVQRSV